MALSGVQLAFGKFAAPRPSVPAMAWHHRYTPRPAIEDAGPGGTKHTDIGYRHPICGRRAPIASTELTAQRRQPGDCGQLSVEWLATLDRLDDQLPADATLYLGHGAPVGVGVLRSQRRYVEAFVVAVGEASDLNAESRREHVVAAMRPLVPSDKLLFLMELSVEPVLAKLVGQAS